MLEGVSRFFLSKKTFLVAIIAAILLELVGMIMELSLNDLIPFELIAYGILFLLLIGLFIIHRRQDYILMNGIVSGILIYEFVRYAYLFSYYTDDALLPLFLDAGFFGCFCFSFLFLSITIVCLITYNHFTINRSHAVNRTKIVLNQFLLVVSFFAPIPCTIIGCLIASSLFELVTYVVLCLSDALLLLIVACCEMQLAMNQIDRTALEELVLSDVKAVFWYAVSLLFSVLCLSMSVLLSNSKAFMYVLSSIDFLLSMGLLIYYLNKNKKSSPKLKIFLYIGLVATIGLMIIFVCYFAWTVFS